MNESKHSPGPWERSTYEGGWDCVRDSDGHVVAKLVDNIPDNANVLAAALDMLEALKHVRDYCLVHPDQMVDDAIAKAEGVARKS